MSKEKNLAAMAIAHQISQTRDFDRLGEVFAEDVIDHDPEEGRAPDLEGIKEYWRSIDRAFPDFRLQVDALEANDDYVMLANRISGTHTGEYKGHAPTGKRFEVRSLQLCRFETGLCVERWGCTDMLGILTQLGVVDPGQAQA
jgi:predicted ester cyclase